MIRSRYKVTRIMLIVLCLFIGLGAFYGGTMMLIKPDGSLLRMEEMLPYFKKLPFSDILFVDYTFSGIMLIIVNGLTNIITSLFLFKKKQLGNLLAVIFGITLMLWISIQFYMFPFNVLSTIYFILGFIETAIGLTSLIFFKQEQYKFDMCEYKNINTNKDEIVIYFSRMGYTKKVAYEEANKTGAFIVGITTKEKVLGTSGFWWCGLTNLIHRKMDINDIGVDLSNFKHVTICSPIWVFALASPMASFINKYKENIKYTSIILVHHTNLKYKRVFHYIDSVLNAASNKQTSVTCKLGKMKYKRIK